MNNSRSFDRAAEFYDNTRALFDVTVDVGIQSLLDAAGEGSNILEVGTGTGRISIPMLERGADLTGCDLSFKMLARQREKYPATRLVRSDAVLLPFPSGHFDALITVHVMHLIGPWREALHEFKRVLKAGGRFLNVSTNATVGTSARDEMRDHWRDWLKSQGVSVEHPGANSLEEIHAELASLGANWEEVDVIHFRHTYTLREELDRFARRISSQTWSVPDVIFQASMEELRSWTISEFGDLDQKYEEGGRFMYDNVRFEG